MICLRALLATEWHGVPVGVLVGAVVFTAMICGAVWWVR